MILAKNWAGLAIPYKNHRGGLKNLGKLGVIFGRPAELFGKKCYQNSVKQFFFVFFKSFNCS
jgi:hypothetical protein